MMKNYKTLKTLLWWFQVCLLARGIITDITRYMW